MKALLRSCCTLSLLMLVFMLVMTFSGCVKKPPDVLIKEIPVQSSLSQVDKKIISLVTESYIPYQFEENGILKGISVDVIKEVFSRLGYKVELTLLPWTRALQTVRDEDTDGIFCAYFSEERTQYMDFMLEPIAYDALYIYTLQAEPIAFDGSIESLKPYRIGVLQDWFYGDAFAASVEDGSLSVEKVTDFTINIQKLLDGKVDAIINPQINTLYYLKQLDLKGIIVEEPVPFREPAGLFLAFAKNRFTSKDLIEKADAELIKMKADGSYQAIVDQYTK